MNSPHRHTWMEILLWTALIAVALICFAGCGLFYSTAEVRDGLCDDRSPETCQAWTVRDYWSDGPSLPFILYAILFNITPKVPARAPSSPCPAIRFGQASAHLLFGFDAQDTINMAVLYRQPDGSFTAQGFAVTISGGTKIASLPQAHGLFTLCHGVGPWILAPHSTVLADLPGTMARDMAITYLGGTAPHSSVGIRSGKVTVSRDTMDAIGKARTEHTVGSDPLSVLVADFTGDGQRDVAALNGGGSVSILPGNGDGTLRPAVNYPVGADPIAMTWFDFNRDGRPDLAVVRREDPSVTVLLGHPDGTLHSMGPYALPEAATTPRAMVAADFDGGNTDLMVFSQDYGFTLLHGNGDGSFAATAQKTGYTPSYQPQFLVPGDFNKDGKPDLASVNYDATVAILLNAGDGSFPTQHRYVVGTPYSMGNAQAPGAFAMDFNDDGKLDLVFAAGHPDVLYPNTMFTTVLFGNGDGTFQGPPAYSVGGVEPPNMASADFNGDGRRDLVVAAPPVLNFAGDKGGLWVLLAQPAGGFQPATQVAMPYAPTWVATADLNGDGRADLVATDSRSSLYTWLGKGDGTFQAPGTLAAGSNARFVTAGDINGDGLPDLVLAHGDPVFLPASAPATVLLLTGKAGGGFNPATAVAAGANTLQVALADVNGDAKLDLVAVNLGSVRDSQIAAGNLSVLLGNGNGAFQSPVNYNVGRNPVSLAIADVNGDGKSDLLAGTLTPDAAKVAVLAGAANGAFLQPVFFDTYSWPSRLIASDFDGDAKLDLAIVHSSGDSPVSVMRGGGDGSFAPEHFLPAGDNPVAAIAADFSGQGRNDLAVLMAPRRGTASVSLFRNALLVDSCTYSLDAASRTFSTAGTGSFGVVAAAGCVWVALTDSPDWITIASGASGTGNGTVNFSVKANTGSLRTGAISVMGQTFTVTQTGAGGGPQWTIVKSHAGNFTKGQSAATYTIRVTNAGTAATSGTVTVTETLPAGLSLVSMSGPNWNCPASAATCTRADALNPGASYPDLTVTVSVSATAPATVTNQAGVSGGGADSASTTDPTTIATGTAGAPRAVSVEPAAGTGAYTSYTFTFSDSHGWQNIGVANVLINNFINGIGACYLAVVPATSSVYLVDDGGNAGGPYQGMTLPGSDKVQNSQCSVTGTGSSIAGSGDTLTVILTITFKPAFAGNKVMYLAARESTGANSEWQALGTCGIPGATPAGPSVGGVTPARSSGSGAQTFAFTFNDTNGWQDLGVVNILINDALNGNQACYLAYSRQYNTLYVVNDAGTALLSGTLANSQCTVATSGAFASGAGNTLTLNLNLTFSPAFAGNRLIYAAARSNGDALNSGWQAVGSRTVE